MMITKTNKMLIGMIFLAMLLVPMASAAIADFGTFKSNTDINLYQICSNCTYNNITSVLSPTAAILVKDIEMTRNGFNYNYTLRANATYALGTYSVTGIGDLDQVPTAWSYTFEVTGTGFDLTTQSSIIYVVIFIIIFFVFILNIFFINKLPASNTKDEEGRILSISYLKYLRFTLWFVEWMLFIGITYLASNLAFAYLGEQMFAKALYMIFQISFALTPVILIVWICWIFAKMFHDKQFQRMLNRGIFPQGKL